MKSNLSDWPMKITGLSELWTSFKHVVSVDTKFGREIENYEMASNLIEDRLVTELLRLEEADGRIVETLCSPADPILKDDTTSLKEDNMTVEGEESSDKDKALTEQKEATTKTRRTGWTSNPIRAERLCSSNGQVQAPSPTTFNINPKLKARRAGEKKRQEKAKWVQALSGPKIHETQRSCSAFWTDIEGNPLTKCWTHSKSPWSLASRSELTTQRKS